MKEMFSNQTRIKIDYKLAETEKPAMSRYNQLNF